nr:hypothetical protein [Pseudomonas uvaldensis]
MDKAASRAPATLGEGCLGRYGPDDLSAEDDTEFTGAEELWEKVQNESEPISVGADLSLKKP